MDTDPVAVKQRLRVALLACRIASAAVAAILLAVSLTVFRVREPVMTMNAISVKGFVGDAAGGETSPPSPSPSLRMTVVADVSVRNPNAASLRYVGSETAVYYLDARVGRARGPGGVARARRTARMNVTVEVAAGAMLGDPAFLGDVAVTATTVRGGRVVVLGGVVRRRVALEMNCSATLAVADMSIRNQSCLQRVWL